jgi:hypothetical protein
MFNAPETKDPRPIFAVAVEVLNRKGEVVDCVIEYLHADDTRSANFQYRAAHTRELMAGKIRIVEVAPAVGWFVQDEHGEVLSG